MTEKPVINIYDDGIKLCRDFGVTKIKHSTFSYVLKIALILFGTVTSVSAAIKPLKFGISIWKIFLVASVVIFAGLLLKKIPKKWMRIIIGIGLLLIAMSIIISNTNIDVLVRIIETIGNNISRVNNGSYTSFSFAPWANNREIYGPSISGMVYAITVIVAAVLYCSVINRVNFGIQLIVTMPLYLFPYILGTNPGIYAIYMFGYYVIGIIMFRCDIRMLTDSKDGVGVYENKITGNVAAQAVAVAASVFVVVLLGYMVICPKEKFKENETYNLYKEDGIGIIKKWTVENVLEWFEKNAEITATEFGGGSLGAFDKVSLTDKEALKVYLPAAMGGNFYIKGYVAATYKSGKNTIGGESSWEIEESIPFYQDEVINNKYSQLANLPYYILKYANNTAGIKAGLGYVTVNENDNSGEQAFMPYNVKTDYVVNSNLMIGKYYNYFTLDNMEVTLHKVRQIDTQYSYDIAYLKDSAGMTFEEMSEYGKKYIENEGYESVVSEYEKNIQELYTEVPDLEKFKAEFGIMKFDSLDECVAFVKEYLSDYKYTLSPGATEKGEDFVEDFLFDRKKGYCTYFATAATLMLREFGYPARYVEGYMIDSNKIQSASGKNVKVVTVQEKEAHAWAEVYVENFGWVVVDATPSVSVGTINNSGNNQVQKPEKVTVNTQETTKKTEIPTEENETTTDLQEEDTIEDNSENNTTSESSSKWIIYFIIAALIPLAVYFTGLHKNNKMIRLTKLMESNKAEDRYKAFERIFNELLNYTKAEIISYETRAANSEALKLRIDEIIRNKNKEAFTADISVEDCRFLFEVLDKGRYSRTLPDILTLKQASDMIIKVNDAVYEVSGFAGRTFIKYIKCLYLTEK